jgi:hypothetical protein
LPTQTVLLNNSEERTSFSVSAYPADRLSAAVYHDADGPQVTAEYLRMNDPDTTIPRRVDWDCGVTTICTHAPGRTECVLYRGAEDADALPLPRGVQDYLSSPADKTTVENLGRVLECSRRQGRHLRPAAAGMAQVNVTSLSRTVQMIAYERGVRYHRFFTCAWLDFLSAVHEEARAGGMGAQYGAPIPAQRDAHHQRAFCHLADIGPQCAVAPAGWASAGGEDALLDDVRGFTNGDSFLFDAANFDYGTMQLVERYAASYPPTELRIQHPRLQGARLVGMAVRIPGASHIIFHTGEDQQHLPLWGDQLQLPNATRILSFLRMMASHLRAWADVRSGYEQAAALFFGRRASRWGANTGLNAQAGECVFNALHNDGALRLPFDMTLREYLRPMCPQVATPQAVSSLWRAGAAGLYNAAIFINNEIGIAWSSAAYACNMQSEAWVRRSDADSQAGQHAAMILGRARPSSLSTFDWAWQNACGHLYGWRLSEDVILSVERRSSADRTYELGNLSRAFHVPQWYFAYDHLWAARAIFDYTVLPTQATTVKWPEDHAYPLRCRYGRADFVRLGRSLAPMGARMWIGDGGAQMSAQHYISVNATGEAYSQTHQAAHQSLQCWHKPNEYSRPAAPQGLAFDRLPAPFEDFIVPNGCCVFDLNTHDGMAFGYAPQAPSAAVARVARQEVGYAVRVHLAPASRIGVNRVVPEYTLLAMKDRRTGAPAGLTFITQPELERADRAALQTTLTSRCRAGPAALANDSRIDEPRRSSRGHQAKRVINSRLKGNPTSRAQVPPARAQVAETRPNQYAALPIEDDVAQPSTARPPPTERRRLLVQRAAASQAAARPAPRKRRISVDKSDLHTFMAVLDRLVKELDLDEAPISALRDAVEAQEPQESAPAAVAAAADDARSRDKPRPPGGSARTWSDVARAPKALRAEMTASEMQGARVYDKSARPHVVSGGRRFELAPAAARVIASEDDDHEVAAAVEKVVASDALASEVQAGASSSSSATQENCAGSQ